MKQVLYGYFVNENSKKWFWSRSGGGLYYQELPDETPKLVYEYQQGNYIVDSDCLFDILYVLNGRFFLIPRYAKKIVILDFMSKSVSQIYLPEVSTMFGNYFLDVVRNENEIILIPQTYPGILHIDIRTYKIKISNSWNNYIDDKSKYIFRASSVNSQNTIYLVFYSVPKVLIYEIKSMKCSISNTRKIDENLEIFEDQNIKLLIINRLDCLQISNSWNKLIDIIGKFARLNALIKTIFFNEKIYFFTDEAIYQIAVDGSKIEIADWFEKIKNSYLNRIRKKGMDRLQDTLYVFKNDETMFVSFELTDTKCIISIKKDKVMIDYEKIYYNNLVHRLLCGTDFLRRCKYLKDKNQIGKAIYQKLI